MDGIYIDLRPVGIQIYIDWDLWKDTYCYTAKERGGHVFIREQRRKFWPKHRRMIMYPKGHEKRK